MDKEAPRVTSPLPELDGPVARDEDLRSLIDTLLTFLDELQRLKFNIGVQHYVDAQNLLISLAARGHLPQDISALRTLLSPLLCCTPEEQERFYRYFDIWFVERVRQPTEEVEEEPESKTDSPSAAWWKTSLHRTSAWWIVYVVAAAALLIFGLWSGSEGGLLPPSLTVPGGRLVPLTLLMLTIALLLLLANMGWRWLRMRRDTRLQLEKWHSAKKAELDKIIVRYPFDHLYRGQTFRQTIQQMRRPRRSTDRFIDVERTVDATVRKGGWFTPIYNAQQASPEYLVLIDRTSYHDQQARLADEMIHRLRENNVFIESYYFQGDPRECRKAEPKAPHLTLQDLAALHPDYYLLVFSDGASLLNPLTGRLQPWLNMLSHWRGRTTLFTPEAPIHWGYRELAMFATEIMVLPATADGLAMFIATIDTGSMPETSANYWRRPFPEVLRERAGRWLEENEPEPQAVGKLCSQLRRFLGDEGYLWLTACAVYPLLQWDLTLYFGYELTGKSNIEGRLMALVRLPWFKHGMMPDWLRMRLISDLTESQEDNVRQKLEELLISSLEQHQPGFPLKFSRPVGNLKGSILHHPWLSLIDVMRRRKRRGLLRSVIETEAEDSPLRDYVFLTFVSGRNPGKLAVTIPHRLMGIFLPGYREAKPSAILFNLSKRTLASIVAVASRNRARTSETEERSSRSQQPPDKAEGSEPRQGSIFSISRFLSKSFYSDLAIDLGTDNTLIYVYGRGITLAEPTLAAVNKMNNVAVAFGKEATEMLGRAPGNLIAIRPMVDSVVHNFDVTEKMLHHFIRKAIGGRTWKRFRVVIGIPSEIKEIERRALEAAAYRAKASEVYMVEKAICAAIGAGLPITEQRGNMIVDIGGGTTEIAVISFAGIVYSRVVRVAGNEMNEAITSFIKRKYNLLIGERTAETIKINLGSAFPLDEQLSMDVRGRNLIEGIPKTITITDDEVREALADSISTIVNAVRVALERTPPELSADIVESGILLTGGGASLKNIDKRLSIETGLPVSIAEDPLSSVVLGAAKMLSDFGLLKRVRWS